MNNCARAVALAAALLSLLAVIFAAMGSHLFAMNGLESIWQTALNIHLFNAAASLGLAALLASHNSRMLRWAAWMVILGTVVFSGNIYMHVISGYTLPRVTPAGGMLMMAGWLLSVIALLRKT
ncbi:MAG: DUF423 domain-containing protein [Xanthomonadales bacterium]|nr:DUF423 domain-containing protein [Gammaproteobacteria bacterium]MBT8074684.1 DUF423 domain-containing protein [Gammaproteobacteria bacterium]NNK05537.1 DUF423 domain-containing protein [Xanthomonadales bacterium]NNK97544.1 DUF423 domain-containing protein [Xanthomonadales bacterium]